MNRLVELDGNHLRLTFFDEKEEPNRLDITEKVKHDEVTKKSMKGKAVPLRELDEELKQL